MKDFIMFWKLSFSYMAPKSKLWVVLHGFKPCMRYLKEMKKERNR